MLGLGRRMKKRLSPLLRPTLEFLSDQSNPQKYAHSKAGPELGKAGQSQGQGNPARSAPEAGASLMKFLSDPQEDGARCPAKVIRSVLMHARPLFLAHGVGRRACWVVALAYPALWVTDKCLQLPTFSRPRAQSRPVRGHHAWLQSQPGTMGNTSYSPLDKKQQVGLLGRNVIRGRRPSCLPTPLGYALGHEQVIIKKKNPTLLGCSAHRLLGAILPARASRVNPGRCANPVGVASMRDVFINRGSFRWAARHVGIPVRREHRLCRDNLLTALFVPLSQMLAEF